jgi:acyl-CoA synthetase (AMP-forming)/AMP-acid ligase II
MSVAASFFAAARQRADRVAIVTDRQEVRYGHLADNVSRLANALHGLGIQPGETVSGILPNSVELVEVSLACSASGLVTAFMNAKVSADEIVHALNLSDAKVLFFDSAYVDVIATIKDRVNVRHYVVIGGDAPYASSYERLRERGATQFNLQSVPWNTPHSIHFTSGTTGQPKGVLLSHMNWLRIGYSYASEIDLSRDPDDVVLAAAPLTHAAGMPTLPTLMRGRRLRLLDHFDPERVNELIADGEVTATVMVPTMIQMLTSTLRPDQRGKGRLRTLLSGGSAFPTARLIETMDAYGPVVVQGFGQWEAPIAISVLSPQDHVYAREHAPELLGSAGRAAMFVDVAILDDEGNELPAGETGEIASAGPHLMLGYYKNDVATREIRHGRWQRTGDVGHLNEQGYLFVTDRKKDMIISGGMNVYPRQIEEVLYRHPQLQDACVVGLPDELWGETVHVVGVRKPGCELGEAELIQWARERLGGYQRVRSVRFVDGLPKNHNGKIMRRELRDQEVLIRANSELASNQAPDSRIRN